MLHFEFVKDDVGAGLSQIIVQNGRDDGYISFLHWAKAGDRLFLLDLLQLHVAAHWRSMRQWWEANLDKLLRVQASMPVSSTWHGGWQSNASSVDCLPNVLQVDSARNLTNQDWGEALRSQVLVHAKEVYLCHLYNLSVEVHIDTNSRNESVKLVLFASTDANEPLLWLLGR